MGVHSGCRYLRLGHAEPVEQAPEEFIHATVTGTNASKHPRWNALGKTVQEEWPSAMADYAKSALWKDFHKAELYA